MKTISDILSIQFQMYSGSIYEPEPIKTVTLKQLFKGIGYMKPGYENIFHKIREAAERGDAETKAELKTKLHSFTPAVTIKKIAEYVNEETGEVTTGAGRRRQSHIDTFTGLMILDFDEFTNKETALSFKCELFENEYTFASWMSSSGKGVRAIVIIPIIQFDNYEQGVKEYKEYFFGFQQKFFSDEVERPFKFDTQLQNPVQPLFISPDNDILIKSDPVTWRGRYKEPERIPQKRPLYVPTGELKDRYCKWSIENFITAIDKITDNGHPQLRAACKVLGGKVGAGYLSELEALTLAEDAIYSNHYLSRSETKISAYKRTAREFINKGMKEPLYFDPPQPHQAKERQKRKPKDFVRQNSAERKETRDVLAEKANISHGTLNKIEKIEAEAPEEIKEKLKEPVTSSRGQSLSIPDNVPVQFHSAIRLLNKFDVEVIEVGEYTPEQAPKPQAPAIDVQEVKELEKYFNSAIIPDMIQLTPWEQITDVRKFIDTHLATAKANYNNAVFLPYVNKIKKLKEILSLNTRKPYDKPMLGSERNTNTYDATGTLLPFEPPIPGEVAPF